MDRGQWDKQSRHSTFQCILQRRSNYPPQRPAAWCVLNPSGCVTSTMLGDTGLQIKHYSKRIYGPLALFTPSLRRCPASSVEFIYNKLRDSLKKITHTFTVYVNLSDSFSWVHYFLLFYSNHYSSIINLKQIINRN